MAKNKIKDEVKARFPSVFASHASMVDAAKTEEIKVKISALDGDFVGQGWKDIEKEYIYSGDPPVNPVVLKDEFGYYLTDKSRLDNGTADSHRHAPGRLTRLFGKKAKEEK